MPNHCYQQVHIEGLLSLVQLIHDNLPDRFCQLILPMPFDLHVASKVKKWSGYDVEAWYAWRVDNWGTKWDVVDVEITEELEVHGSRFDDGATGSFSFQCWTAWSPPVPVWDKLHGLGISVVADYQDEGMMFEGRYVDGVDESWDPDAVLEEV